MRLLGSVALALLLVGAVGFAALELESAVRSYVRGESLWSKAQKEAVIALDVYARSGREADWRRYREAIQVPLADRQARLALESEPPDLQRAREGLLGGGLQRDEIPGMIRLFRWFEDWGPMRESIRIWTRGDSLIGELRVQADRIRREWRSPPPDPVVTSEALERVAALDADLSRVERRFSLTIDSAADLVRRWSQWAIGGLVALLLVGAVGLTVRLYRHLLGRDEALRRSERRYRELFEHNVAGTFRTRLNGTVVECNRAFARIFGYEEPGELEGQKARTLYPSDDAREEYVSRLREEGGLVNEELQLQRRDGSSVWVLENSFITDDPETGGVINQGTLVDITERKRSEERLRHQALHDPLTGLPNRALLADRMEQGLARARRHETPLGLLMLDVDRFKRINDRLGHAAGDRVLKELARRLEKAVREEDTVARWGGDEFVVVLPALEEPGGIADVPERIREAVRPPIQAGQEEVSVHVTMGGVVHSDSDHRGAVQTEEPEELIRFGSLALHWAKEESPAGFKLFDPDGEVEGAAQIRYERELRDALEERQIVTRYQPVVRLDDGALVGIEVLARWQHPERGLLPPAEFIPLAEELGLIGALDELVLRQGCREVKGWSETNGGDPPVPISFNLSGQQFGDPELVEQLGRSVEDAGLRPEQVILEVTETSLMQVPATIEEIRARGFSVYADDFGTGYSTFTYLRDLHLDGLKIDMSFVQGLADSPSDAAIVEAMVTLGRRLELEVIAEGVEVEAQRQRLRDLGCELGQGFLFARPEPGEEMAARWREEAE